MLSCGPHEEWYGGPHVLVIPRGHKQCVCVQGGGSGQGGVREEAVYGGRL